MLKAKLDSVRKNKKGFSLVELIIVIAIMVALIAVLAPSYIKYVQKSRKSAYENACEEYLSAVKEKYADPDNTEYSGYGSITIAVPNGTSSFTGLLTSSGNLKGDFSKIGNAGDKKLAKVDSTGYGAFKIEIASDGDTGNYVITMKQVSVSAS